jgi:hypothetical protein
MSSTSDTGTAPGTLFGPWTLMPGLVMTIPVAPNLTSALALRRFQYVQQNDVMTFTDQSGPPMQLVHHSDTYWSWTNITIGTVQPAPGPPVGVGVSAGVGPSPTPAAPTGLSAIGGSGGAPFSQYVVTTFDAVSEGPVSSAVSASAGLASAGFPVAITWGAVGGASGYCIYKSTSATPTPRLLIGIAKTNAFSDTGFLGDNAKPALTSAAGTTIYDYVVTAISSSTGSETLQSAAAVVTAATPTPTAPNVISWTARAGASSYNIYLKVNGRYAFIGSSATTSFNDINITPNTGIQPPSSFGFSGGFLNTANDQPQVVGYYQQRLCFANTINQPQSVWMSRAGDFAAFSVSTPVQSSDAVQFTLAGRSLQAINSMVDLGKLILHTTAGEYVCTGDQSGAITPTSVGVVQQGYSGSQLLQPVSIGNTDLFVQARGTIIRDLQYSIQSTSYTGKDCTIFASSLFQGTSVVVMDWQQVFNSIVWTVLANGALVGLTYIREHEIWGWHRHDTTSGLFQDVAVCPEGSDDAVYTVVKRAINGGTNYTIERLAQRNIVTDALGNVKDWATVKFSDACLTYDGRNTTSQTLTLTTAGGWTITDTLTMTLSAGAAVFAVTDIGNDIILNQVASDGTVTDTVRIKILAFTDTKHVTGQATSAPATWAQGVALTTWGKAVHQFSGMGHLEGQTINALGDGDVVGDTLVVSGGAFTTAGNYLVLTAGLPIVADLQTLPLENAQGESIADKQIRCVELTAIFNATRGGSYGQDFAHLNRLKQRANEPWATPTALFTGNVIIPIQGAWQSTGQIAIRQLDPLPMGISALIPTAQVAN